jgi:hypothetical protein
MSGVFHDCVSLSRALSVLIQADARPSPHYSPIWSMESPSLSHA